MELRHLGYFVAVADELHFGRAAERLGMSQPPLSQQIRRLEAELGVALFERTSRRVQLTEVGVAFLVEARRTLEQADRAIAVARRAQRGEFGKLAIGFTTSAPFTAAVAKALFDFRTACPDVELALSELPRSVQIARLTDNSLDIGFVRSAAAPVLPEGLVATPLLAEPLVVVMRRDHRLAMGTAPLRIADLVAEDFVLYDQMLGAGFNDLLADLCRSAGFEPRVVQEAGGLASLLGLVAAGFGLTLLSRSLAALHLDSLVYRPLDEPAAISRLWLVHPMAMAPACQRFVGIMTAE